jgi:hypothetical protein
MNQSSTPLHPSDLLSAFLLSHSPLLTVRSPSLSTSVLPLSRTHGAFSRLAPGASVHCAACQLHLQSHPDLTLHLSGSKHRRQVKHLSSNAPLLASSFAATVGAAGCETVVVVGDCHGGRSLSRGPSPSHPPPSKLGSTEDRRTPSPPASGPFPSTCFPARRTPGSPRWSGATARSTFAATTKSGTRAALALSLFPTRPPSPRTARGSGALAWSWRCPL